MIPDAAAGHGIERLRRHLRRCGLESDFGVVALVEVVLGLLIVGGRRLRHLVFVQDDPLFQRLCGLRRLPTPRTVGRWLRRFTGTSLERLLRVNDELVAEVIRAAGLRRLTLDVDGTVVRCVTPGSPLGSALMGRQVGDDVELQRPGGSRLLEVVWIR